MLNFTSVIDLSLPSTNTNFKIYSTFAISHSKPQFQLGPYCTKRDSVSYGAIFNIKRFDLAPKCFYFKIMKKCYNVNCILVIEFKGVSANKRSKRFAFFSGKSNATIMFLQCYHFFFSTYITQHNVIVKKDNRHIIKHKNKFFCLIILFCLTKSLICYTSETYWAILFN